MESRSYSTLCQLCGQSVRWSDSDPYDEQYNGLFGKLKYHLNNGACARNEKIKEIIGEETKPNVMKFYK